MPRHIDYNRKRGDTAQPFRYVPSYSDDSAPNFVGATVRFLMKETEESETYAIEGEGDIDPDAPEFSYAATGDDVDQLGYFVAEWEVTYADSTIETWPVKKHLVVFFERDL